MLIIDAHLDLALNALQLNRDLLVSAHTIRTHELGTPGKGRAKATTALPDMRRGRVALSIVTAVAKASGHPKPHLDFRSATQTYAIAQGHLAYYRALEEEGHLRVVSDRAGLDESWAAWERWEAGGAVAFPPPLGVIFSMECADAVLDPEQLEAWYQAGLRLIGPTHFGPGRYAAGTGSELGLTEMGPALLKEMERLGIALDMSHTSDQTFWESLEHYQGPILASHNDCRALVPNKRHLTDAMIEAIIERDGVIGATLGNWQLHRGWDVGKAHDFEVTLEDLVDHIDHICQLAGNARHVGIGSDLDGGVGFDEFPAEIDTVDDMQKIPAALAARGYGDDDIRGIMHGNWLRFLRRIWS
jgi:membrane dipeptidase